MPGHQLFDANKQLWAAAYLVGLGSFLIILMPMPFSWAEVDWSIKARVLAYCAYFVFAVAAWILLRPRDLTESRHVQP